MLKNHLEKLALAIESPERIQGTFGIFPDVTTAKAYIENEPTVVRFAIALHLRSLCKIAQIPEIKSEVALSAATEIVEYLATRWHVTLDKNWLSYEQ